MVLFFGVCVVLRCCPSIYSCNYSLLEQEAGHPLLPLWRVMIWTGFLRSTGQWVHAAINLRDMS